MTTENMTQEVQVALDAVKLAEDQLRAARQAAAEAAQAQREAERKAAYEKQRVADEEARKARIAWLLKVCGPAISEAEADGFVVKPQELTWDTSLTISKVNEDGRYLRLCYVEYTNKAIVVHDGETFDTKSRFPKRQDGTFNEQKVNDRIRAAINAAIARRNAAERHNDEEVAFGKRYLDLFEDIKQELKLAATIDFNRSHPGGKHYPHRDAEVVMRIRTDNASDWHISIRKNRYPEGTVSVSLHGTISTADETTPLLLAKLTQ